MKRAKDHISTSVCILAVSMALQGCHGILDGIYYDPTDEEPITQAGQLYIDASDWHQWHFIDLKEVLANSLADPDYNPSSAWQTYDIPLQESDLGDGRSGIYTYWYDVLGAGLSVNEFRSFMPTAVQPEPESWTFAVHRDNARTNGCAVAVSNFDSMDQIPEDKSFLEGLDFTADRWSENEVWCIQDNMLSGLIGNQGITINPKLSSWLKVELPPIPPAFTISRKVMILRLPDSSYAAIQLGNYQSAAGVKCSLTINYRYPL